MHTLVQEFLWAGLYDSSITVSICSTYMYKYIYIYICVCIYYRVLLHNNITVCSWKDNVVHFKEYHIPQHVASSQGNVFPWLLATRQIRYFTREHVPLATRNARIWRVASSQGNTSLGYSQGKFFGFSWPLVAKGPKHPKLVANITVCSQKVSLGH